MKLFHAVGLAISIATVFALTNTTTTDQLNDWYPCAEFTFSDDGVSSGQKAECAIFMAPLCYPGICDSLDSEDPKIDVFVKRMPVVDNAENATNVFLTGGAGLTVGSENKN
ncbi:hypothetical protein PHYSODRAFT_515413 [Phytophthora sojae]|uniref:Uncharacterized protein n=1 Tax=Phytophthora sojae (strain P6497) TaxID=1094619 RepID=G4ZXR5_PHYSP|nr:hypothetical protein PHYSODRAFT_515413 [Phytophthora sojae]EGZ11874.1 hypothetical protein PHYSODRAFT_515413 [Phytophthora sojae]|eukprot:XP_009532207.1 hypothetical protein PHYSODRAFT_515413 [Phytophthora sojae]